jgi:hypothetical protein
MNKEKKIKNSMFVFEIFNHNIERVYNIFKDPEMRGKSNHIMPFVDYYNESEPLDKADSFILLWKNHKINYKLIKKAKRKEYKEIVYKCTYMDMPNLSYININRFYYSSIENKTIMLQKFDICDELAENFTKEQWYLAEKDAKDILVLFNKFLSNNEIYLYQEESILINKNYYFVWKIITNWTLFQEMVPLIAESVDYNGNPLEEGTKFSLKWGSKNIECQMKVVKVNSQENTFMWEYFVDCYDGKPKITKQELQFRILKVDENKTYLSFKHVFKEFISKDFIEIIVNDKKNILKTLKLKLEKLKH